MKRKITGIIKKLTRMRGELFLMAGEFGDLDNYLMTLLEEASDRMGEIIKEIEDCKNAL